jgi:hypothetical protein
MTAEAKNIPEEIFFHFAIKRQSVDALFNSLYDKPTEITKQHFLTVNAHLDQQVRPGQMVIVTPPNAQQCSIYEADLSEAARRIDQKLDAQSEEDARVMAEYYDLLANAASYSGIGYGIAANYFKQHKNQVEQILKQIERLYVSNYNKYGRYNNEAFFQQRRRLFRQLDNVLKTMVGRARMGLNIERGNLKRSLGLSSKSLVHQLKEYPGPVTDLPGFEKNHGKVVNYSKILRRAGYVGIALDGAQTVATISKACTAGTGEECTKSYYSEGGRFGGSVVGGAGGGVAATYVTCNLVFGIETLGTSLLWCGIVAGGVGGYLGAKYTSKGSQATGEILYEYIHK